MRAERGDAAAERALLEAAIEARGAIVGVVGLGYVGLPLLVALGQSGFRCVGVDLDAGKCASLRAGTSYVGDVAGAEVATLLREGRLTVADRYEPLLGADVVIICVPTPVYRDKRPDLRCIASAGEALGSVVHRGQLVVLESTCYPGTTEELLQPALERGSGLRAGVDFWLAFSPERIDPGNTHFGLTNTPKVVGGIDAASGELARALYATVVPEVVVVSSTREAEMSKLIENTFRHVNIALANELAIVAEELGIDFWEAVRAAASKPFGFMPFYPGPGVGGHCIPVDPHYLAWKARECEMPLRLIDTAEQINANMPRYVVEQVIQRINDAGASVRAAQVLLLGVAYKGGIADMRESPALRIMELLESRGAVVSYHDPYVPELSWDGGVKRSVPLDEVTVAAQDCVVLVTDHGYDIAPLRCCRLLLDTRNAVAEDLPNRVCLWGTRRNGHAPASGNGGAARPNLTEIAPGTVAPAPLPPEPAGIAAPRPEAVSKGVRE